MGELQLGETADPTELIHGDPAVIRETAGRLSVFADGFGEAADGLYKIDTGHWEGAAADAFRAKFAPEPAKWAAAADAMSKASGALASFAGVVEAAQRQAQQAIELWDKGQQVTARALAANTSPLFIDPGARLRLEAFQILREARADRDAAAGSATAVLRAATDMAPPEPSLLSRAEADLSDALGAGQLAQASFSAGILTGAADIVKFGQSIDPNAPWNLRHPAEYLQGLNGTLAGLTDMEVNPSALVGGVAGTGWSSDPAQALGHLVPNVALTALTDGAGAAADASAAAGAGDMGASASEQAAAQGVGDMTRVGDPVNVATGDVVFTQTDVSLPGVLPLTLERVHKSSWRGGRWFGETWASSLDQRLLLTRDRIAAVFADGRVLLWRRSGDELPLAGPAWPLRPGPDGSYTVTDPQQGLTWRYAPGQGFWRFADGQGELPLVSVTDRAGHVVEFSYDEAGQPEAVTHSGGYQVRVSVTGGRVTGLAAGDTSLVRYAYDEAGHLAAVVSPGVSPDEPAGGNSALRFGYDDAGRMTQWTDRLGHSYRYFYDSRGRCVRGESPSGELSGTFEYGDRVTVWTDAAGERTEYRCDGAFGITGVVDALGHTTGTEHDDRGRVTARIDPLGRVTRYSYDTRGNLVAVTRPDGGVARAEYDERCLPVRVTDADGGTWRQSYDARGNRTEAVAPDGSVTRFGYDAHGHLASLTGADGAVTRVTCDAAGLLTGVTDPAGRTTRYSRDALGRVVRVLAPDGSVTSQSWTAQGRLSSRTLPDGTTQTWEWDGDGHLTRHVSPGGAVTAFSYGPFGTVVALEEPDGVRSEFGHDHALRLTSVTRGGLTWTYDYDRAGRLVAETDYNGARTRYRRDAAGQVVSRVNAAGQEVRFGYDPAGQVAWREADGEVSRFGYDAAGRLLFAHGASVSLELERDALGRVLAQTCNGRTVRTSHDSAGRVARRVTPSGSVSSWTYDVAGLPSALSVGDQEMRFTHGALGREATRALPGGVTLAQDWDTRGRLTRQVLTGPGAEGPGAEVDGELLQRRSYSYSGDGFVTGLEDLLTGARAFGLDAAGRVEAVAGPEWFEQYDYDALGNVTGAGWPAVPPALNPWLDDDPQGPRAVSGTLVERAGSVRYRHDAAGRVVTRTRTGGGDERSWHYGWDAESRLTAVTLPDGSVWEYSYDPLGRRVAKRHVGASGGLLSETTFAWDGAVLAESVLRMGDREDITTWDYQPGSFAPLAQSSRTSLSRRDAPGEVIRERFYAIVSDLAGTPTEMVAADGGLAGYQQHTLWGAALWHPSGSSTPLRFPGQYADAETGLHYNNQRFYDPVTSAYLSPDPLGLAPGPNPHAYVLNPHVLADPLGLEPGAAGGAGTAVLPRRLDGQLVLSGHGAIHLGDGTAVTVPPGTSFATYSLHGQPISDLLGNHVEVGNPAAAEVYGPGEQLPDYYLLPAQNMTVLGLARTVDIPTRLSDLLAPDMGVVHWAACRVVRSALW